MKNDMLDYMEKMLQAGMSLFITTVEAYIAVVNKYITRTNFSLVKRTELVKKKHKLEKVLEVIKNERRNERCYDRLRDI